MLQQLTSPPFEKFLLSAHAAAARSHSMFEHMPCFSRELLSVLRYMTSESKRCFAGQFNHSTLQQWSVTCFAQRTGLR